MHPVAAKSDVHAHAGTELQRTCRRSPEELNERVQMSGGADVSSRSSAGFTTSQLHTTDAKRKQITQDEKEERQTLKKVRTKFSRLLGTDFIVIDENKGGEKVQRTIQGQYEQD